jgi:hypothetical protein
VPTFRYVSISTGSLRLTRQTACRQGKLQT